MYRKILVPIDGSELSLFALREALRLATGFGAKSFLTVIYVSPFNFAYDGPLAIDMDQVRRDTCEAVIAKATPWLANLKITTELVTLDGDPAQEICRKAREGNYDLIVLGNQGHGLFTELLTGSVSMKVVQHAHCPVLVVRDRSMGTSQTRPELLTPSPIAAFPPQAGNLGRQLPRT
jgi:nucleotide-binding universal stress UspA family protein